MTDIPTLDPIGDPSAGLVSAGSGFGAGLSGASGSIFGTGSQIAGGIGSFAGAAGDFAEASAYGAAAKLATQNATISGEEGKIKEYQTQRQVYQVLGGQGAGYGANNIATTGSALDVHADSVKQGALQKAIVAEQTAINVNGYVQQADQFKSAQSAATGAGIGGIISGIAGIFGL